MFKQMQKEEFQASFGLLSNISGCYTDQGKLQVDVVQLKGPDLEAFLSAEELVENKRWKSPTMVFIP